jgi:hypothetical protein
MKFSKFVKSLAPAGGAIYEYMGERWLASPSVLMLIPDGIRSVTGYSNEKMPDGIGRLISQVGCTEYATLVKAIMPEPDGAIKDCVRIFATPDSTWSLIEKSDFCEILYAYDLDSDKSVPKALLVKRYTKYPDDEDQLVGIIFPCEYTEQLNFHTMKEDKNNG